MKENDIFNHQIKKQGLNERRVGRISRKLDKIYLYNRTTLSSLRLDQLERAIYIMEDTKHFLSGNLDDLQRELESRKKAGEGV